MLTLRDFHEVFAGRPALKDSAIIIRNISRTTTSAHDSTAAPALLTVRSTGQGKENPQGSNPSLHNFSLTETSGNQQTWGGWDLRGTGEGEEHQGQADGSGGIGFASW